MRVSLHVLTLAVAFVAPLSAQVAASQGNATTEEPKQFASPMILDIPLRGLGGLGFEQGFNIKDTEGYFCEDATITRLLLVKKHGAGQRHSVRIEITGSVSCVLPTTAL
jgi:hypothetical protein